MHFLKKNLKMKKSKVLISVFIVLLLIKPLAAQTNLNDSSEVYHYWAHRGIIEMVFAYMNDYIEAVGETKAISETEGKDKYEHEFISVIDDKKLPDFETVSTFLKSNSWSGAEKKLFQPLVQNYKNSVKLNSSFFDTKKPGSSDLVTVISGRTNKKVNWENRGKEIIDNYEKELADLLTTDLNSNEKQGTQVNPTDEEKKESQKQLSNSIPNWINRLISPMLFVLGMSIGGWFVFSISKRKIYSILKVEKKEYLDDLKYIDANFTFKYIGLVSRLRERKEHYKTESEKINKIKLNSLKEQIRILQKENAELKQIQKRSDSDIEEIHPLPQKENTREWDINHQEKIIRKLFFSMPENDGRFIIDNGDPSNDGRKYYKIEYLETSEEGELYFISSDRDKRAINRLESYLKPACDIENIINSESATRIDFISPGRVILINNSWVIDSDRKVKIQLI